MRGVSRLSLAPVIGVALALALPLGVSAGGAGHGSLDPRFGSGGIVRTSIGASACFIDCVRALAVQPDGKTVVAATTSRGHVLVRYTAKGSLDPSFGKAGKVATIGATAEALVLQPDSKLVVAGRNLRRPAGFVLHRYRSNCSPDASFGSRGRVITPTRGGEAVALAIQPDRKLVAAGGDSRGFLLARYTPNGRLDPSFGSGGKVSMTAQPPNGNYLDALAIQADRKIVAAGTDASESSLLVRYQPNAHETRASARVASLRHHSRRRCGRYSSNPTASSLPGVTSFWVARASCSRGTTSMARSTPVSAMAAR